MYEFSIFDGILFPVLLQQHGCHIFLGESVFGLLPLCMDKIGQPQHMWNHTVQA